MDVCPNMKNSNVQYMTLPMSLASDRHRSHPFSLTGGNNTESFLGIPDDSSHSKIQSVPAESNDDDIYMYTEMPHSFPTNRSSLRENKIKELPVVKSNYYQSSVNGTGVPSYTIPTGWKPPVSSSQKVKTDSDDELSDDGYAYKGLPPHRVFPPTMPSWNSVNCAEVRNGLDTQNHLFPPTMPSWNSVNSAEVRNGLDTQNHLNLESRHFGCNERAVYQEALKHIGQERREEDLPEGVLSVSLLKHQKIALAWMVAKENSSHCSGGILADDQGLGKTISTIALIQKERSEQSKFMSADSDIESVALSLDENDDPMVMDNKDLRGEPVSKLATNLKPYASGSVAADHTTVKTLKIEPKKNTRVSLPSSASTLRSAIRPAAGTLVVCPASILKQWANEISAKVTETSRLSVLVYHGGSRTKNPAELTKYDVVVTTYIIVGHEVPKQKSDDDEEQKNCEMYGVCPEFSVGNKRKLAKSTKCKAKKKTKPKSSDDLDGGPLARVRWFRVVLDEAQTIKNYRTKAARACSGLRAKRRWCLSGTPMQNTIDDMYSYFRFLQYEPYSEFSSFRSMIKYPISRGSTHGYKKLQTVLKIVLLRRTKETLIDGEPIIKLPPKKIELKKIDFTREERYFYLTLEEGSPEKFKKYAAAGTIKQNYANILVLLLRLRQACDHPILLKEDPSNLIDNASLEMAKQLPKDTVIYLLQKLEFGSSICSICSDIPEDAVVATCNHVFCRQCVLESLTSDENVCPSPLCGKKISAESVFPPAVLKFCISDELESDTTSSFTPADADESSSIFESSYISSKIRAATDILNNIFNTLALTGSDTIVSSTSEIAPPKAIVFSQWTGMLDLMELSLNSNLIKFRRLDGAMSLNIRESQVEEFKTNPEVKVMLMSLKAGNLGLNMVAACHVIMLDPWWNPYAEDQAVDRAHRIGQTRPVTVSRLTIKDTVEDRILALQEKKRKMVQSAFGEDNPGGSATRLTVEDLGYLFDI